MGDNFFFFFFFWGGGGVNFKYFLGVRCLKFLIFLGSEW